jgi:FeS assembly SUF system regulator
MIRISRLTDYGIVLMSHMAAHPDETHNAAEIALAARLPVPTVSKLLRQLAHEGLLTSHRGVKGGYSLARRPEEISVASIIRVLEGPIALTACVTDLPGECEHESQCPVRGHWSRINHAVREALDGISLSDMASPMPAHMLPTAGNGRAGSGADGNSPPLAAAGMHQRG